MKKYITTFVLLVSATLSFAVNAQEPKAPQLYEKRERLPKEKFEELLNKDITGIHVHDWEVRPNSYWAIFVPDWFGKIVEQQVRAMGRAQYFDAVDASDFYHGHLVMKREAEIKSVNTPETMLRDVGLIVYHTDESGIRWALQAKTKAVDNRTPRSVAAYMDGSVAPAKNLVDTHTSPVYSQVYTFTTAGEGLAASVASVQATLSSSGGLTISNAEISDITKDSATIKFTTNIPASTQIFYGKNDSYERSDNPLCYSLTAFTHKLTGLSSATTYRFKILASVLMYYEKMGSIHDDEVIAANPTLYKPWKPVQFHIENTTCTAEYAIFIRPFPDGRYTIGRKHFDIYFKCLISD